MPRLLTKESASRAVVCPKVGATAPEEQNQFPRNWQQTKPVGQSTQQEPRGGWLRAQGSRGAIHRLGSTNLYATIQTFTVCSLARLQ